MSQQAVASIKASNGTGNYCLGILSSLSLSDEDKLSFVIGNCLINFNKHIVCSLSPWISDMLQDECCCLKGHVFISLPEETSLRGFLSLKAVIETGVTHELSNLDKDELSFAIKLLGMDIQLTTIVTVDECTSDEVDCDAQQNESIISTEDMFSHNVEMDSEQTISVEDMEADNTNNNKTLEPRNSNGMEEIQDANKDLKVLEEINMVNSMENAQHNLNNMKPVLKQCEVKINRINRKSFGIMRNCCVKIKRLDREFYNSSDHLKCNLKQRLPSSQAMPRVVDMSFPQSSSSAAPAQQEFNTERGKINFSIKESDKSDSLKSSRAIEKDNADISMVPTPIDGNDADIIVVPTPIDRNDADISMVPTMIDGNDADIIVVPTPIDRNYADISMVPTPIDGNDADIIVVPTPIDRNDADISMVPTPIDGNNGQEHSHSTVILYSANCDEYFSSFGHAHSTDDGKETPIHAHSTDDSLTQEYHGPVEEEILMEVDNGDLKKSKKIHDESLTLMLPPDLDAEVDSVPTPSLLGCSKSVKKNVEFSNDEEDVEKQIELVPKIKIKRNLIQWAT